MTLKIVSSRGCEYDDCRYISVSGGDVLRVVLLAVMTAVNSEGSDDD